MHRLLCLLNVGNHSVDHVIVFGEKFDLVSGERGELPKFFDQKRRPYQVTREVGTAAEARMGNLFGCSRENCRQPEEALAAPAGVSRSSEEKVD
jgi:hypothetical protein